NLRLQEQQQVIAPACLRVSARHIEPAERMHTNKRAGALTIQIQIPDVKLFARAIQLRFVSAVNRARQTKLRVVRDLERVVVVLSLDDREHWSKDLLLLDRRARLHISDYSRLNEEALLAIGTAADQNAPTFTLPFFNVRVDRLERLLVDHGAHRGRLLRRIGKLNLRRAVGDLLEHRVVNSAVDDRA